MMTKDSGISFFSFFLLVFNFSQMVHAQSLENGEKVFTSNCSVCHLGGNNIIIPEKNLKKGALEANGMNTVSAISYQVINGKNGMPAFGGRLTETDIEDVATYILQKSENNFQEEFKKGKL
jgi:cytochrome c6